MTTATVHAAATATATRTAHPPVHALSWFEIPVRDLAAAGRFYEAVLGTPLREERFGGPRMAVFAYQAGAGVGGALVESLPAQAASVGVPSAEGTRVYLPVQGSLEATLGRLEAAGGRITQPPLELPHGIGTIAVFVDPDGNRVGLHRRPD